MKDLPFPYSSDGEWLECAVCGAEKAFQINPSDPSVGYCRLEDKRWQLKPGFTRNFLFKEPPMSDYRRVSEFTFINWDAYARIEYTPGGTVPELSSGRIIGYTEQPSQLKFRGGIQKLPDYTITGPDADRLWELIGGNQPIEKAWGMPDAIPLDDPDRYRNYLLHHMPQDAAAAADMLDAAEPEFVAKILRDDPKEDK